MNTQPINVLQNDQTIEHFLTDSPCRQAQKIQVRLQQPPHHHLVICYGRKFIKLTTAPLLYFLKLGLVAYFQVFASLTSAPLLKRKAEVIKRHADKRLSETFHRTLLRNKTVLVPTRNLYKQSALSFVNHGPFFYGGHQFEVWNQFDGSCLGANVWFASLLLADGASSCTSTRLKAVARLFRRGVPAPALLLHAMRARVNFNLKKEFNEHFKLPYLADQVAPAIVLSQFSQIPPGVYQMSLLDHLVTLIVDHEKNLYLFDPTVGLSQFKTPAEQKQLALKLINYAKSGCEKYVAHFRSQGEVGAQFVDRSLAGAGIEQLKQQSSDLNQDVLLVNYHLMRGYLTLVRVESIFCLAK